MSRDFPEIHPEFPPAAPGQQFDPAELGLDLKNETDLQIYNDAAGDKLLAAHMLAQRDALQALNAGEISREKFDTFYDDAAQRIEDRRHKIFPPQDF